MPSILGSLRSIWAAAVGWAGWRFSTSRACSPPLVASLGRSVDIALCDPLVLRIHRGDIQRLRLLRLVRMHGSGIDLEVAHLLPAERPARHHAFHRLLQHPLGEAAGDDLADGAFLDPARMTGVPIELL